MRLRILAVDLKIRNKRSQQVRRYADDGWRWLAAGSEGLRLGMYAASSLSSNHDIAGFCCQIGDEITDGEALCWCWVAGVPCTS